MKTQTIRTITTHLLRAALVLLLLVFAIYVMPRVLGNVSKRASKAQPATPEGTIVLDHFKAYKVSPPPPPLNVQVGLKDQFDPQPESRTVLDPFRFANPVKKDRPGSSTPITNPESHLKIYNLNPITPPSFFRNVIVKNQFGPQALNVLGSTHLAVPTRKNNEPPFHDLDHFKCYDCTGPAVNLPVNLTDQFHVENNVGVLQPRYLCNPVSKFFNNTTTPIIHPDDHLVFYTLSTQPPFNTTVNTANQFGTETNLPLQEADLLGVPSYKVPLNHFKAYKIPTNVPPLNLQVQLRDQFDLTFETRTVLNPFRFANPVNKTNSNGGIQTPITNPESHLKLYNLNPLAAPTTKAVAAYNQFGPQKLKVQGSRLLALPTQKNNDGPFHDLDHFKCYDCTGDPVNVPVNLIDQFHTENNVVVLQPRYFCNPVVKFFTNTTTPIVHPQDHLIFYAINPQPPFAINVNTANQFGAEPNLPLQEADLLGVPSLKLAVAIKAVSRKVHSGIAGTQTFDVDLPLSGTPGIECRTGGATGDFTMVVTFLAPVTVTGSPQADVTTGIGDVGSGGVADPNGTVSISGSDVTIPLTNIGNAQTINVTLNGVNGAGVVTIPMSILLGDTSASGATNSSDVSQTKAKVGQVVSASNFRTDVTLTNSINSTDVSIVKSKSGTALPP